MRVIFCLALFMLGLWASAAAGETAPLPALPGFPGLVTVPHPALQSDTEWWLPVSAEFQAVAVACAEPCVQPDFSQLDPGTTFTVLAPGVRDTIAFYRYASETYGGDGGHQLPMASFTATSPLPTGAVWLLPPGSDDSAACLKLERIALSGVSRAILPAGRRNHHSAAVWRAGPVTIVMQRISRKKTRLSVVHRGRVVYTQTDGTYSMSDDAVPAVDFSLPPQPGIPVPLAVFSFSGSELPVILLRVPGYEGNCFDLLTPAGSRYATSRVFYLYYMAY